MTPPALPDLTPLLAAYDLAPPVAVFALPGTGTNNRIAGVRTGAGDFVWKIYQTFGDPAPLRYEGQLLTWLAGQDLPFAVPAPLPGRSGETLYRTDAGWQALFPLLPGRRPDERDPAQVAAGGAALAELHGALARCPAAPRPGGASSGDLDPIHPAVPAPEGLTRRDLGLADGPDGDRALAWWREHLRGLRAFIAGPYRALPRQLTHGDFVLGNTLFDAGRVTAILDFEFAGPDARAVDVASGLEFAMRPWEGAAAERIWPIAAAFCRGYARWNGLTEAEVTALPWLIRLRDTASTLWHTGQTLARGHGERNRSSFERLRGTARWLEVYEGDLVATARRAFDRRAREP